MVPNNNNNNNNNNNGICSSISTKWLFIHYFKIELEFRSVDFCGGRKTVGPWRKALGAGTRANNKLNPHVTPEQGIEPGPKRCEHSPQSLRSFWPRIESSGSNHFRHAP